MNYGNKAGTDPMLILRLVEVKAMVSRSNKVTLNMSLFDANGPSIRNFKNDCIKQSSLLFLIIKNKNIKQCFTVFQN